MTAAHQAVVEKFIRDALWCLVPENNATESQKRLAVRFLKQHWGK